MGNHPLDLPASFWGDLERALGKPYVWAAEIDPTNSDPEGFDCSELVQWAYDRVGIDLPDGTWNLYKRCDPVDRLEVSPGDLAFFCDVSRIDADAIKYNPAGVYHVGVVWKDKEQIIDARAPWRKKNGIVLFGRVMLSPKTEWESWRYFGGYRRISIR